MFLKLFKGCAGVLSNRFHTQRCIDVLFDQRRKVEDEWRKNQTEWNDDEDEQRRAFYEEEGKKNQIDKQPKLNCEVTKRMKVPTDCECKNVCCVRLSETHLIYYEGGVGIIKKK